MPRTIGSVDKYKSWKKNQSTNDLIDMVTLDCHNSNELQHQNTDGCSMKDKTMLARDPEAGASTKRGSFWEVSEVEVDGNESKEEWTRHPSKETCGESVIVPRSFLAGEYQAKKP